MLLPILSLFLLRRDWCLGSNLRDIDFSFCLWCCCCYFFNNFAACWGLILPLIIVSSCLLYLFYRVSFSSSSSDLYIIATLLVVFSFLGEMCVRFKGFLFFLKTFPFDCPFFFYPLMAALFAFSSPMALLLLVETTSEIELLGLW